MTQQINFIEPLRLVSPIKTNSSQFKKGNVYFTYNTSPQSGVKQNLNIIKQRSQSSKKRKIFQSRRKLSFKSIQTNKKQKQRLKIFDKPQKYIPALDSHIFLKQSTISGVQTIVDQLQKYDQKQLQTNPIKKKLSQLKNKQKTKRTFYSNTVKNSIKNSTLFTQQFQPRRNRIQSQVLTYHYSPTIKNKSVVTIKASKQNKVYRLSKYSSNGISINTNQNPLFSQFKSAENVQTPKNKRSAYKHMRKSFEPSFNGIELQKRQEQIYRKKSTHFLQMANTDRFYDQSSLQTPRLELVAKKISYQVADPLTNSLRKQKLERKRQKMLQQQNLSKKQIQKSNRRNLISIIFSYISQTKVNINNKVSVTKQNCINFTKSQTFIIIIIFLLSMAIFMIQLFQ